jgi:hypothetical protein
MRKTFFRLKGMDVPELVPYSEAELNVEQTSCDN